LAEADDDLSEEDEAFVRLMTARQKPLRAYIYGLVLHQGDADDLLQEVNLALWRKRRSCASQDDFGRWAYGFAAMEVRRYRRQVARGRLWFSDEAVESLVQQWPPASAFWDEGRRALSTCIKKLRGIERQVIEAKYAKQLSVKEISVLTGKPPSTVYRLLARGRDSLRACVKRVEVESHR
jgi:RNA polymerase sigma-70 factor (ECF subfamily)